MSEVVYVAHRGMPKATFHAVGDPPFREAPDHSLRPVGHAADARNAAAMGGADSLTVPSLLSTTRGLVQTRT